MSGVALPYPNFSGTIAQMLRPFPQYSGVTDVYGNVAWSTYHSLQLTLEKRRSDDGLTVNFNYTFSRTEDNLAARTGYNFDQDWAVGVNDQPHVLERARGLQRCRSARRASRAAAIGSCARSSGTGRSPASRSSGRAGRLARFGAACNLPNAGTCYADFNPAFIGPSAHQRRLWRRRRARRQPAVLHRPRRVSVAGGVHIRQHAADPRARFAEPRLLQPGSQHPARIPHFPR